VGFSESQNLDSKDKSGEKSVRIIKLTTKKRHGKIKPRFPSKIGRFPIPTIFQWLASCCFERVSFTHPFLPCFVTELSSKSDHHIGAPENGMVGRRFFPSPKPQGIFSRAID